MTRIIPSLIEKIKKFFGLEDERPDQGIYEFEEEGIEEIHSVWDYLKIVENTQAFHISSVIGFDEWVSMEEIRRRVLELFGIEYKNERSLYPYIKTMVDLGILESTNVGGKKRWRKKDLLIKIKEEKKRKNRVDGEGVVATENKGKKKSN